MKFPTALLYAAAITGASASICPALAGDTLLASSSFSTDLDGWTSNTPAEITWVSTGGHPGGAVMFSDQSGAGTYLIAPAKFLSPAINYTQLNGKGYISWQHKIVMEAGVNGTSPYEIRMSGPNGAAKFDGSLAPSTAGVFQTVVAPLQFADWTVTSGTWSGLLANVTMIQIDIELVSNNTTNEDIELMDNIDVVYHPASFSPGTP